MRTRFQGIQADALRAAHEAIINDLARDPNFPSQTPQMYRACVNYFRFTGVMPTEEELRRSAEMGSFG